MPRRGDPEGNGPGRHIVSPANAKPQGETMGGGRVGRPVPAPAAGPPDGKVDESVRPGAVGVANVPRRGRRRRADRPFHGLDKAVAVGQTRRLGPGEVGAPDEMGRRTGPRAPDVPGRPTRPTERRATKTRPTRLGLTGRVAGRRQPFRLFTGRPTAGSAAAFPRPAPGLRRLANTGLAAPCPKKAMQTRPNTEGLAP